MCAQRSTNAVPRHAMSHGLATSRAMARCHVPSLGECRPISVRQTGFATPLAMAPEERELRSERAWRHKSVRLPDHRLLALSRDAQRVQASRHFRSMWFVAEFPAESSSSAQHAVGPGFRCVITLICYHMLPLPFKGVTPWSHLPAIREDNKDS
jgi:hypothetical protein